MGKDGTFQMRVDKAWMKALDDWRRKQDEIPSRAEAIRRLIAKALDQTKE